MTIDEAFEEWLVMTASQSELTRVENERGAFVAGALFMARTAQGRLPVDDTSLAAIMQELGMEDWDDD